MVIFFHSQSRVFSQSLSKLKKNFIECLYRFESPWRQLLLKFLYELLISVINRTNAFEKNGFVKSQFLSIKFESVFFLKQKIPWIFPLVELYHIGSILSIEHRVFSLHEIIYFFPNHGQVYSESSKNKPELYFVFP